MRYIFNILDVNTSCVPTKQNKTDTDESHKDAVKFLMNKVKSVNESSNNLSCWNTI